MPDQPEENERFDKNEGFVLSKQTAFEPERVNNNINDLLGNVG